MFTPLLIGGIGPMELFIVLALVVLLFGAQKLPELARGAGQAAGEFQRGREEIERELATVSDRIEADVDTATTRSAPATDGAIAADAAPATDGATATDGAGEIEAA